MVRPSRRRSGIRSAPSDVRRRTAQTADSVPPMEGRAAGPRGSARGAARRLGHPRRRRRLPPLSARRARSPRPPFVTHGEAAPSAQVAGLARRAPRPDRDGGRLPELRRPPRRGEPRAPTSGCGSRRGTAAGSSSGWGSRSWPGSASPRSSTPGTYRQSSQSVVRVFQSAHGFQAVALHRRRARRRPARRGAPLPGGAAAGPAAPDQPDDRGRRLGARVRPRPRRPRPGRRVRRPRPLPPRPRLGRPGAADRRPVPIVPPPRRLQPARRPPDPPLSRSPPPALSTANSSIQGIRPPCR